eukprot:5539853-Pyramimonas_sp.AAC.1
MVVFLIVPPAILRISAMWGNAHVNIIRARRTFPPSRGRSRDRAGELPRDSWIVQIISPHVGD